MGCSSSKEKLCPKERAKQERAELIAGSKQLKLVTYGQERMSGEAALVIKVHELETALMVLQKVAAEWDLPETAAPWLQFEKLCSCDDVVCSCTLAVAHTQTMEAVAMTDEQEFKVDRCISREEGNTR